MQRIHLLLVLLVAVAVVTLAFLIPQIASAGPLDVAKGKLDEAIQPTGLQSDAPTSVGIVVRGVLSVVGTIFLVLTVYAGILWMTAQGAAEQIEKAQSIISAAIIGLFITMAAYAITTFVTGRLGQTAGGGGAPGGGQQVAPAYNKNCTKDYKEGQCAGVGGQPGCGNGLGKAYDTECTKNNLGSYCCYNPN